jgi:LasA protease
MEKRRPAVLSISAVAISVVFLSSVGFAVSASTGADVAPVEVGKNLAQLALPSIQLPVSNRSFLYGPEVESFDLENYLARNAPKLRAKAELIDHWSGYYSINPKVVLTLAEMQSAVLTKPDQRNLQAPFGTLSRARGFDGQLRDVLHRLSVFFYGFEANQAAAVSSTVTSNINGATAALVGVLKPSSTEMSAAEQGALLSAFVQQFRVLFPDDASRLLAMETDVAPAIVALAPPANMMQMPWRRGYAWRSNGAHSHTGSGWPLSSIDVAYDWPSWGSPTYSVTAAHDGTARVMSRCQIRVTNPNGWATNYYHLDQIQVNDGQWVTADTKLGVYASSRGAALCQGGSSTGPHLHFSLLNNGRYVSLQDANFSVYRVNVGSYNYDNDCRRFWFNDLSAGGSRCAWSWLHNYGPWSGK